MFVRVIAAAWKKWGLAPTRWTDRCGRHPARCLSPFFFIAWLLVCMAPAHGQGFRQPNAGQPQLEAFEAEGTIEAVAAGKIQIATNANQRWIVMLTPQTKVEYTGAASVDVLRPGMGVKFTAPMDKQGTVKEKVARLTVFTPSQENPLGFWSAAEGAPAAGEAPAGGAPAGAPPAAGDPFGFGKKLDEATGKPAGKPAGKTVGKPAGKAAATEAGTYLIAGRITSYHAGKLQLTTGNAVIKAEVAADAQVDAKLSDCTLARKGDHITVSGQAIPKGGLAQAASVKITAAEPLAGGGKVKPTKPAKEPRTPKKSPRGKEPAAP
jgi:hypothetical protein